MEQNLIDSKGRRMTKGKYEVVLNKSTCIGSNLEIAKFNTKDEAINYAKGLLKQIASGNVYVTHETICPELYINIGSKYKGMLWNHYQYLKIGYGWTGKAV